MWTLLGAGNPSVVSSAQARKPPPQRNGLGSALGIKPPGCAVPWIPGDRYQGAANADGLEPLTAPRVFSGVPTGSLSLG
ncbi:hypothetical protein F5Y04DRAFT_279906 [Hypomontagnella monticulosa]|nr:hypothetical protein F5Y04DRAFT_279906 [Hypomontagnella monticulosa]